MAGAKENLTRSPPALASALMRSATEREVREAVLGDLQEEFELRARTSLGGARSWYWRQALASAAPLWRARLHRSAFASSAVIIVLSVLAFACVYLWEVNVARGVARAFRTSFDGAPIAAVRTVFVAAQMLCVAAAALAIAIVTFRADEALYENALRRLSILALLVLGPQFVRTFVLMQGYDVSFVIPWALAMATALWLGAALGARIIGARR